MWKYLFILAIQLYESSPKNMGSSSRCGGWSHHWILHHCQSWWVINMRRSSTISPVSWRTKDWSTITMGEIQVGLVNFPFSSFILNYRSSCLNLRHWIVIHPFLSSSLTKLAMNIWMSFVWPTHGSYAPIHPHILPSLLKPYPTFDCSDTN